MWSSDTVYEEKTNLIQQRAENDAVHLLFTHESEIVGRVNLFQFNKLKLFSEEGKKAGEEFISRETKGRKFPYNQ